MGNLFGWSYPPGCSGGPYDDDPPCEICGCDPAECECEECPACGEAGRRACIAEHSLAPARVVVWSSGDIANTVTGLNHPDAEAIGLLRKWAFKHTTCGCSFEADEVGITVSGYCEGVDVECPVHELLWGQFTASEYFAALDAADTEGVALWNDTHGCSECRVHWGGDDDEYCPVWAECPECGGNGEVY
jgi:hypothetical protein